MSFAIHNKLTKNVTSCPMRTGACTGIQITFHTPTHPF
jgi:hypothetical protein